MKMNVLKTKCDHLELCPSEMKKVVIDCDILKHSLMLLTPKLIEERDARFFS